MRIIVDTDAQTIQVDGDVFKEMLLALPDMWCIDGIRLLQVDANGRVIGERTLASTHLMMGTDMVLAMLNQPEPEPETETLTIR